MSSRAIISLGDERIAHLDRIAKSRGVSRSAVIRQAVDRVIEESVPDADDRVLREGAIGAAFGTWKDRTDIGDAVEWQRRERAALRRERSRLRLPHAVIHASAQVHGRILITRNTRDFPADMPDIRVPYSL